jgi:hypothetical protein
MQRRNVGKAVLRLIAGVGVLTGALLVLSCGGGGEEAATPVTPPTTAPVAVAASDLAVPVAPATVQTLEAQTFTFSSGAALTPALANQPITLAFTNTTSATPTATVTAPNVRGTDGQPARFAGTTEFGSCTFVVTTSTFPAGSGPQVGDRITVNPCQVNVSTGGVQATGQATTVQILLQLGATPSAANQSTVSINPTTGVVTINNVTLPAGVGSVTLQTFTGGTGSSPG